MVKQMVSLMPRKETAFLGLCPIEFWYTGKFSDYLLMCEMVAIVNIESESEICQFLHTAFPRRNLTNNQGWGQSDTGSILNMFSFI